MKELLTFKKPKRGRGLRWGCWGEKQSCREKKFAPNVF